jgi:hypothetical protein
MIGAIAHTIFIAYAAPNSKTLAFAQSLISAGKSVATFASSSNPLLQEQGIGQCINVKDRENKASPS